MQIQVGLNRALIKTQNVYDTWYNEIKD